MSNEANNSLAIPLVTARLADDDYQLFRVLLKELFEQDADPDSDAIGEVIGDLVGLLAMAASTIAHLTDQGPQDVLESYALYLESLNEEGAT